MKHANSMIDLIGGTPLIRLNSLSQNANIFAKCEFMNPYSIKDRAMKHCVLEAEREGKIHPGDTLIEATSGNTGIALAAIGAARGYRVILLMADTPGTQRRMLMKSLGAELILTPRELGTAGARKEMEAMLLIHPEYYPIAQHSNPNNPAAHYLTTGPELWQQMEGRIDLFLATLGTGGTVTGVGRYLKEQDSSIQVYGMEPETAPLISRGEWHPHRITGASPGFVADTLDASLLDGIALVKEEDAFAMVKRLAREEGLLVGLTGAASLCALIELAARPEFYGKNLATVLPDAGERYLDVPGLFE